MAIVADPYPTSYFNKTMLKLMVKVCVSIWWLCSKSFSVILDGFVSGFADIHFCFKWDKGHWSVQDLMNYEDECHQQ